jgi:hypothetical protein
MGHVASSSIVKAPTVLAWFRALHKLDERFITELPGEAWYRSDRPRQVRELISALEDVAMASAAIRPFAEGPGFRSDSFGLKFDTAFDWTNGSIDFDLPCENWHREVPCGVELIALLIDATGVTV